MNIRSWANTRICAQDILGTAVPAHQLLNWNQFSSGQREGPSFNFEIEFATPQWAPSPFLKVLGLVALVVPVSNTSDCVQLVQRLAKLHTRSQFRHWRAFQPLACSLVIPSDSFPVDRHVLFSLRGLALSLTPVASCASLELSGSSCRRTCSF